MWGALVKENTLNFSNLQLSFWESHWQTVVCQEAVAIYVALFVIQMFLQKLLVISFFFFYSVFKKKELKNISGQILLSHLDSVMVIKHFSICIACLQLMLCPWIFSEWKEHFLCRSCMCGEDKICNCICIFLNKLTKRENKQAETQPNNKWVGLTPVLVSFLVTRLSSLCLWKHGSTGDWTAIEWSPGNISGERQEAQENLGSLLSAVRFFWLFLPQRKNFAGSGCFFFLKVLDESLFFILVKDIRKLLWLCSHPSFPCSEPWVQWPRSLQHLPREHKRCCRLWPWDGQGEICLLRLL